MGERKGLFSRFFGRKKKEKPNTQGAPAPVIEPVADTVSLSPSAPTTPQTTPQTIEPEASPPELPEIVNDTTAPPAADGIAEDIDADATESPDQEKPIELPSQAPITPADTASTPPRATLPPTTAPSPAEAEASVAMAGAPLLPTNETTPEQKTEPKKGFFGRLTAGLSKTSQKLSHGIGAIFTKRKLDDATLEELEDLLITADLGIPATTRIIAALSKGRYNQEISDEEVRAVLAEEICQTLEPLESPLAIKATHRPHIILMTGVNGAGKTTTIGKLAKKFTSEGKSVLLAAGDTFRAAAIEQLKVWGERTGTMVIAKETGADAAGLAFDAIKQAQADNIDIVMIDTAGRLQNRRELMDELAKIVRVIEKLVPGAPHDTLLVLDATVGQNALSQTKTFTEIANVSGLVMTKLDGTARGGVLVALGDAFKLPIHYIGVGESAEDLHPFSAERFAAALTAQNEDV